MIPTPSPTPPQKGLPHWLGRSNRVCLPLPGTSLGSHFQNVRKHGRFRTSLHGRTRGVFENDSRERSSPLSTLTNQCGSENTYSIPPFELFSGKSVTAFTNPF